MELEDEIALKRAMEALNEVFTAYGIPCVGQGHNLHTVTMQYINKQRRLAKPKNPVGRPRKPVKLYSMKV